LDPFGCVQLGSTPAAVVAAPLVVSWPCAAVFVVSWPCAVLVEVVDGDVVVSDRGWADGAGAAAAAGVVVGAAAVEVVSVVCAARRVFAAWRVALRVCLVLSAACFVVSAPFFCPVATAASPVAVCFVVSDAAGAFAVVEVLPVVVSAEVVAVVSPPLLFSRGPQASRARVSTHALMIVCPAILLARSGLVLMEYRIGNLLSARRRV
jgi:hypothetical protein